MPQAEYYERVVYQHPGQNRQHTVYIHDAQVTTGGRTGNETLLVGEQVKPNGDDMQSNYASPIDLPIESIKSRKKLYYPGHGPKGGKADNGGKDYSGLAQSAAAASKPARRTSRGRRQRDAGMRQGGAGTPNVTIRKR